MALNREKEAIAQLAAWRKREDVKDTKKEIELN
jgi:hypothetical protein